MCFSYCCCISVLDSRLHDTHVRPTITQMIKNKEPEKLLKRHRALVHSEHMRVSSHVQRPYDDWVLNTLMIEGYQVPFQYKRKQQYKSLKNHFVNLTYYAETKNIAGLEMEVMNVVRVKIA